MDTPDKRGQIYFLLPGWSGGMVSTTRSIIGSIIQRFSYDSALWAAGEKTVFTIMKTRKAVKADSDSIFELLGSYDREPDPRPNDSVVDDMFLTFRETILSHRKCHCIKITQIGGHLT